MLKDKTTQKELSLVFDVAQAQVSKALHNVPCERDIRTRESIYETAKALTAMRAWFLRRREYFEDRAERLATQARIARDELRRFEKGKDGGANG